jgi:hypothetical protein
VTDPLASLAQERPVREPPFMEEIPPETSPFSTSSVSTRQCHEEDAADSMQSVCRWCGCREAGDAIGERVDGLAAGGMTGVDIRSWFSRQRGVGGSGTEKLSDVGDSYGLETLPEQSQIFMDGLVALASFPLGCLFVLARTPKFGQGGFLQRLT